jgi:hypothetical protein
VGSTSFLPNMAVLLGGSIVTSGDRLRPRATTKAKSDRATPVALAALQTRSTATELLPL